MVGGGFRPQGQAPSLEEVLEKVLQQWRGFKRGPIVILIAVVVALILLWSAWFTVQPEETGIVQRFGKVVRTAEPGLHFKLPYGIETIRTVPTARVLKEEFGFRTTDAAPGRRTQYAEDRAYKAESLMLTGDLNVIDVQWIIQYRIEDPVRFLFYVRDTQKTIRDMTEAVMRRVVGNRLGSDVLTVGRVEVSSEAKVEIQGKGDAEATRVYGDSFGRNPEFYAFLRTLEVYREGSNKNSVLILTTDSDFYRYLKQSAPDVTQGPRIGAR